MNAIDRAGSEKLYRQLIGILKEHIEQGGWKVGLQIPTEEQLASLYSLSKATVKAAISELVSLGYLKRIQGKGTFVRRRRPGKGIAMLLNLGDEDIYDFHPYICRTIETKTLKPDEEIRDRLDLSEEDYCFFHSRLITAEGGPALLQKAFIPHRLMPGFTGSEDMTDISIYAFLEMKCGIRIQRVKESVDAVQIDGKDAGLLAVKTDLPVLRERHICYAHGDSPVSYSESLMRTDRYAKTLSLERLRI